MISITNLNFEYKKNKPIFSDFNLSIGQGERWSIIGPSGCGKTTLLYILAGLRSPNSGAVSYTNGHSGAGNISQGLILQDYGLLPWLTAYENVALGLKIRKFDKNSITRVTQKWLRELNIMDISDHYPAEMSGGQRQRTAIARTLALEPSLLLMDEPFASLDTINREDLLDLILELSGKLNSTMVLVTHNIEEAVFWGSKILILKKHPNDRTFIIENELSGCGGYRDSAEFRLQCRKIREAVETGNNGVTVE